MRPARSRPQVERHRLHLPAGSLVVAIGASGSGKSTFLERFPPEAVISSDRVRHELLGNASDHGQEARVWRVVYARIHQRLARGLTTFLDATSAAGSARRRAIKTARQHGAPVVLLVFDTPLAVCLERNRRRVDPERSVPVPEEVIRRQHAAVRRFLEAEPPTGADALLVLRPETIDAVDVAVPAAVDSQQLSGTS